MIYCPYTDCDISEDQDSSEHIIPLSLGGIGGLEIDVDRDANSQLGNELEGALANDFFVSIRRTEHNARGHSRKDLWAISKKATYGDDERLAQVQIHRYHGLKVWDVIDGEYKNVFESVTFNTSVDLNLPIRFTAKVALSAGHFVYGDLFHQHVDHHQLRDIMWNGPERFDREDGANARCLHHLAVRADHYLYGLSSSRNWRTRCLRIFCNSLSGSVVILIPSENYLATVVGILGKYLALINVPADTREFPNEGDYAWGHVLSVTDGRLRRFSWEDGLKYWLTKSDIFADAKMRDSR